MTAEPVAPAHLQALFSPSALQDPYSAYDAARALGEVQPPPPGFFGWFAFGHPEVSAVLKSPHGGADRFGGDPEFERTKSYALLKPMMLFHDGASHARLRGLATQAFTPKAVGETREFVQGAVNTLLDAMKRKEAAGEPVDFVRDLAVPLPVTVILQMLGLPADDGEKFKEWSDHLAFLLDGSSQSREKFEAAEAAAHQMSVYFRDVADELRAHPKPGLMSALALAEADQGRLNNEELLANAVLLLAAGHETTTNLLSGGLLALAQFPEQWRRLVQDETMTANAVEELLRFVSPVQGTSRLALADFSFDGVTIPTGSHVNLFVAAANRDARVFPEPHRLDLSRPNAKNHLAFAVGAHYCLGASLARLEGQIVFRTLADRFPGLSIAPQPLSYRANFLLRGLEHLFVALG
ncbi:cytochrome P450 [Deinococcus yavapaiensis]|uniref:Cytochrome P450 n=1 Tax=Deinococcus yavapaiensis KR-236 TaxID=694435 RepID=A0A318S4N1_9DEIO|nr:cytochrome P450 [Deinococcus yavapaiensis]PYE53553.1 cytochrome P450 [Deinococcus yavapaiensis KR-236]